MVLVRLTRTIADRVQGVDLRSAKEGDVLDLTPHEADALIRGDYAERVENGPKNDRSRRVRKH
jgi:hypothetical protein